MKKLKELIRIITKAKARNIEVIGQASARPTKVAQFYEALQNGELDTDEQAARYFYGKRGKASNYWNLKSELKKRLLNSLFFINLDDPHLIKQEKAYYRCYKDWAAAKILLRQGARHVAIELLEGVLRDALRYDFTELSLQASQVLRFHYGSREGNLKKVKYYNEIHHRCQQAWLYESQAEEYYTLLTAELARGRSAKKAISRRALEYYEQLKEPLQQYPTYRLLLIGHLIRVVAYRSLNDYEGTIASCREAICAFEDKPYKVRTPLYTFLHQQLLAHIQLKQFEKGKAAAEAAARLAHAGTANWFINLELMLALSLHTRNYKEAYRVYRRAVRHRGFRRLRPVDQEQWRVSGAYLQFLMEIGELEGEKGQGGKFRISKFLNEVPVFSQDKRGRNIAILIAQILFLIVRKQYGRAISRFDAIEKYRLRYLHRESSLRRSNYFVRMLLVIPDCSFHKAAVLRKAKPWLKKLRATPLQLAHQPHGVEVIPYEQLWEFTVESLEPKFFRSR